MNLFGPSTSRPRLKRLCLGTRWGDDDAAAGPAPGDPGFDSSTPTTRSALGCCTAPPQRAAATRTACADAAAVARGRRRKAVLMLTRFVRPADHLHDCLGRRAHRDRLQISAGRHAAGIGRLTVTLQLPGAAGSTDSATSPTAEFRSARSPTYQAGPGRRCDAHLSLDVAQGSRRSGRAGAQRLRGRRAVRRPAAHTERPPYLSDGSVIRRGDKTSAASRADARSAQRPGHQHPEGQAGRIARRVRSACSTVPDTTWDRCWTRRHRDADAATESADQQPQH